jgi:aryl-alcohol dehydrogenase-like predicted oxidoreductase
MVKLKQEGKIGGIGLSEIAPYTLRRAAAVHPVMAVQNEYSLWTRLPELGLLQACAELGTTFVSFSSVGRGVFSNRVPDVPALPDSDFRTSNPRFAEPNYALNKAIISKFNEYANSQGMSPATMANAWVLHQGDHVIAIPGTRTPDHLAENAAAADVVLTDTQRAEIDRLLPVGFAYGDRYSDGQSVGPERYC